MEIQTPEWVKNSVFYQIFPDCFARSQQPKPGLWVPNNLEAWDASPSVQGYKGGDLWGVIEKLDYIKDLGVNAIYFTPIFQSASNHRYHTHDYYQVDPMLGGNIAFDALLDAAHQRNMKVVVDGVFNHASRGFLFFNDILEHGPYSAWIDWFIIEGWPLSAYDGSKPANYVSWDNNRALPQFNHANPQVREYLMQVGEYWVKKGIDGWRLDVPNEVKTPGFWQEFRDRVKAINSDAYIVGEIWGDSRQWLDGTQFDGVMNYLFAAPTIAFTAGDRVVRELVEGRSYYPYPPLSAPQYAHKIQQLLDLYPWEIQLAQLNLLNSHDTARLLSIAGSDRASVELATLLLFTFPGAPSIFYGDEVGLSGKLDPDSRRGFPKRENWDLEVLNYHQKLISLRCQYPALRTGNYRILHAQDSTYVFSRSTGTETLIVAINVSLQSVSISVEIADIKLDSENLLYGKGEISWQGDRLELNIPSRTGCIIG
jgi:glycosidase